MYPPTSHQQVTFSNYKQKLGIEEIFFSFIVFSHSLSLCMRRDALMTIFTIMTVTCTNSRVSILLESMDLFLLEILSIIQNTT